MQQRTHYVMNRATKVMNYLKQPRTMAQVLEHFGHEEQARFAVYNLVKRGLVVNLQPCDDAGKRPGLFVVADRSERTPLHAEGGKALAQAWGARA